MEAKGAVGRVQRRWIWGAGPVVPVVSVSFSVVGVGVVEDGGDGVAGDEGKREFTTDTAAVMPLPPAIKRMSLKVCRSRGVP